MHPRPQVGHLWILKSNALTLLGSLGGHLGEECLTRHPDFFTNPPPGKVLFISVSVKDTWFIVNNRPDGNNNNQFILHSGVLLSLRHYVTQALGPSIPTPPHRRPESLWLVGVLLWAAKPKIFKCSQKSHFQTSALAALDAPHARRKLKLHLPLWNVPR